MLASLEHQLDEKTQMVQKLEKMISVMKDKEAMVQQESEKYQEQLEMQAEQMKDLQNQLLQQQNSVQDMIQMKEQEKTKISAELEKTKKLVKELSSSNSEKNGEAGQLEELQQENKALRDQLMAFRSLPPGVGITNLVKSSSFSSASSSPSYSHFDRDLQSSSAANANDPALLNSTDPSTTGFNSDTFSGTSNKPTARDEKILAIEGQRDALREALRSQRERKDHEIKTLSERVRQLEHRLEKERHATVSVQQKLLNLPSSSGPSSLPLTSTSSSVSIATGSAGSGTNKSELLGSSGMMTSSVGDRSDINGVQSPTNEGFNLAIPPPRRKVIKHSSSFYHMQQQQQQQLPSTPSTSSTNYNNTVQYTPSPSSGGGSGSGAGFGNINLNSNGNGNMFGGPLTSFNSFSFSHNLNSRPSSRSSSIADHHDLHNSSSHSGTIPLSLSANSIHSLSVTSGVSNGLGGVNSSLDGGSRPVSPVPFNIGLPVTSKNEFSGYANINASGEHLNAQHVPLGMS